MASRSSGGEMEYPRQHSTIINRIDVSNPEDDNARERLREAEAQGLQVTNDEGETTTYSSPPSSAQKRQDFSNEKVSRRDTRLGNYILGKTLGEGEFGKVKLGWKQGGNTTVAVKIIRKEKLNDKTRLEKVNREVKILQGLDHPNIVRLHEMVETDRTMGIVLEYAPNGELFNHILNQRYLKDNPAQRLFAQLISAVGYLHKMGIIHRDLKLENLLLDRNFNIIVTDFGFANRFDPQDELDPDIEDNLQDRKFVAKYRLNEVDDRGLRRGDLMATSCGSPCYAAPELVISDGLYTGRKVDVWSVGVILYAMLAGYLPYDDDPRNPDGDNINLLYSYISETDLKFPEYVSPGARDLLKRILVPDPKRRADLFEVARHSWLLGFESVVEAITSTMTPSLLGRGHGTNTLTRSASARAASNPTVPTGSAGLIPRHPNIAQSTEQSRTKPTPRDTKRQTVQVEYTAPRQALRDGRDDSGLGMSQQDRYAEEYYASSPTIQYGKEEDLSRGQFPTPVVQQAAKAAAPAKVSMPPVSRPFRDVPRAVTDSNFANLGSISTTRPVGQGPAPGERLPSRGSYGQPAAAQVATTSAQGHFAQPRATGSAPYASAVGSSQPQVAAQDYATSSNSRPTSQQPFSASGDARNRRGHSRSQTLSDLTQRVFGRSPSTKRAPDRRPRPDRAFPPTSMKPVDSPTTSSRKSSDSRPSFAMTRKSTDFATNPKRQSRRFSLLPKWASSKPDLTRPQTSEKHEPVPPNRIYSSPQLDGAQDRPSQIRPSPASPPPTSYQPAQQQAYSHAYPPLASNLNPNYRVGSAQSDINHYTSQAGGLSVPSRYDTPASLQQQQFLPRREKPPFDTENMSYSKKMGRGGPAQRVMDFFSGRRKRQGGMA